MSVGQEAGEILWFVRGVEGSGSSLSGATLALWLLLNSRVQMALDMTFCCFKWYGLLLQRLTRVAIDHLKMMTMSVNEVWVLLGFERCASMSRVPTRGRPS